MGSGFSKMKKQARQLERLQEEMKGKTFEGTSAGGLVSLKINGDRQLEQITINPECVDPADVEGLQDLILEAFSHAYQKISEDGMDLSKILGPGMF